MLAAKVGHSDLTADIEVGAPRSGAVATAVSPHLL
jgi:hypothetical protein